MGFIRNYLRVSSKRGKYEGIEKVDFYLFSALEAMCAAVGIGVRSVSYL
jgi:hypothetical protein